MIIASVSIAALAAAGWVSWLITGDEPAPRATTKILRHNGSGEFW